MAVAEEEEDGGREPPLLEEEEPEEEGYNCCCCRVESVEETRGVEREGEGVVPGVSGRGAPSSESIVCSARQLPSSVAV